MYLNKAQLKKLGFTEVGRNNKISKSLKTFRFHGKLGSNNRIDEDVILKGNIIFKNNIHIARGCTLSASENKIDIESFVSLSNFVQIFCASDDYKGLGLSGGTLTKKEREKYSKLYKGNVKINKGSIIGPFSIILPNTIIKEFMFFKPYSLIFKKTKQKNNIKQKNQIQKLFKNYYKKN